MISAKIIADSISPAGTRLTTMQITMHRFVLAEFNTHRSLSRNFRSSRAVPSGKLIQEVRCNPALPVVWRANKPGMQGGDELDEEFAALACREWTAAAADAADRAEALMSAGLHKSWANRLLEPFLYVHGVVTATDWANFFSLRRHPDAQPEIKALADAMWDAMQAGTPTWLEPGSWHIPYVGPGEATESYAFAVKLSAARCARVSYRLHDGTATTVEQDLALAERLLTSRHMSPFEHQATPDRLTTPCGSGLMGDPHLYGNFTGWVQFRKTLLNEVVLTYTG